MVHVAGSLWGPSWPKAPSKSVPISFGWLTRARASLWSPSFSPRNAPTDTSMHPRPTPLHRSARPRHPPPRTPPRRRRSRRPPRTRPRRRQHHRPPMTPQSHRPCPHQQHHRPPTRASRSDAPETAPAASEFAWAFRPGRTMKRNSTPGKTVTAVAVTVALVTVRRGPAII